jgi:hypothetical protein
MRIRDSDAAMQPLSVASAESPAPQRHAAKT